MSEEHYIYLGLGSNIDDRYINLKKGIKLLNDHPHIWVLDQSHIYQSPPLYNLEQANFYNMVVKIFTKYSPRELLKRCQYIENTVGRRPNIIKNRERKIDIDIIIYGDKHISDNDLKIPHPKMLERKFVLYPLMEIEPDYYFNTLNKNINEIINSMDDSFKIIKLPRLIL